jgi:hypothetical protein
VDEAEHAVSAIAAGELSPNAGWPIINNGPMAKGRANNFVKWTKGRANNFVKWTKGRANNFVKWTSGFQTRPPTWQYTTLIGHKTFQERPLSAEHSHDTNSN